jgi:hypothetical protein
MSEEDNNARAAAALEFERLLGQDREEDLHVFLASRPDLLAELGDAELHWSKVRLGAEYVADFLIMGGGGHNDPRPQVTLIELERGDIRLFTSKGDPAAYLTHAVRQVQDWKRWVMTNRDYLARELEERWTEAASSAGGRGTRMLEKMMQHFAVQFVVLAGRRMGLTVQEQLRLAQMNDDLLNIRIKTYDTILDRLVRIHGNRKIPDSADF